MPKPKRHKILVEVTDYEGSTNEQVCRMVENTLKIINKVSPRIFVNARAKSMGRVIRGLLTRLSDYETLNVLEGKTKEGWKR